MVQRPAEVAGVASDLGCHARPARGTTAYLEKGGPLEHAQATAGHASARTAELHDRHGEQTPLGKVERIAP